MKRGLVMKRDCRWVNRLGAMLVLALATGCGKVPTWGELTGQQPAASSSTTPVAVQPTTVPTPTTPVQPPKPKAAEVIAKFKALRSVEISDSSLAELASLTEGFEDLTEINATSSSVTDSGLAHLSKLPLLKKLELTNTKVTDQGMQHLAQVPSLESLALQGTTVSDAGVASLTTLPNLKELDLRSCHLTPEGFAAIGKMPALEEINLEVTSGLNDLTLDLMCEARTLKRLNLRDCGGITDNGLRALRKLDVLEAININRSGVTGEGFLAVTKGGGLKNMKLLGISVCPITEKGAQAINSMKSLEHIDLQLVTSMNDLGFAEIVRGMKKLKFININDCANVAGPKAFAALKGCDDLETLHASNTNITDASLVHLKGLKNLKTLTVNGTKCTLVGVRGLKKFLPDCEIHFASQKY